MADAKVCTCTHFAILAHFVWLGKTNRRYPAVAAKGGGFKKRWLLTYSQAYGLIIGCVLDIAYYKLVWMSRQAPRGTPKSPARWLLPSRMESRQSDLSVSLVVIIIVVERRQLSG
jgi:hypothetical protein